MTGLPLISQRSSSRSTYNSSSLAIKQETYAQKYQLASKVTNYQGMSQQMIWKEYQKLRQSLKSLNESVLQQIDKRQISLRKQSPRKKSPTDSLAIVQEQCKTVQQAIRLSTIQLTSFESKLQYVSQLNVQQLQDDYRKVKLELSNLKSNIKSMKTKTFLLSKNLTKGLSSYQKMSQQISEIHFLQRKVYKQQTKLDQSQELIQTCKKKLQQLSKVSQQRQVQYGQFQQQIKQSNNVEQYIKLINVKKQLQKYDSPYRRNYFLKLKELQTLVGSIQKEDLKISETQLKILKIKKQVDTVDSKTMVLRRQLKKDESRYFNSRSMEMRQQSRDQQISGINDKQLENKN